MKCDTERLDNDLTAVDVLTMQRQLNHEQRQLYNHVGKWCDAKVRDSTLQPFRIFLTGGVGTGKSHVRKCIKDYAEKAFAQLRESSNRKQF